MAAPAWTSRIGSVAPAVARTLSCGIEIPCVRRNSELQAPPAINTLDVATSLFGDDTTDAAGRDLEQACRAVLDDRDALSRGRATQGSARMSDGVVIAPLKRLLMPGKSVAAPSASRRRVSTPSAEAIFTKSAKSSISLSGRAR
jgi:hypothetical protein